MNRVTVKFHLNGICIRWLLVVGVFQASGTEDILKYDHKHRTHKAVEKANGLWCYRCYTMDVNKEYCMDVSRNDTWLHQKCEGDHRMCMVKQVSYSTATANASSIVHKVWSLERNCTHRCEPGCIIIGERIKLYQCVSCCEGKNFCNVGNGGSMMEVTSIFFIIFTKVLPFLNIFRHTKC